jgi:hypothetical protein
VFVTRHGVPGDDHGHLLKTENQPTGAGRKPGRGENIHPFHDRFRRCLTSFKQGDFLLKRGLLLLILLVLILGDQLLSDGLAFLLADEPARIGKRGQAHPMGGTKIG